MEGINSLSKLKIIKAPMVSGGEVKISNSRSRQKRNILLKHQWRLESIQVMETEQGPFIKGKIIK